MAGPARAQARQLLGFRFMMNFRQPYLSQRFQEFWRFYEIKYGIGIRGITWVYTPIGLLGIMGPFMIFIGT